MDKERQEEIDSLQALYYEGDMAVVIHKAQELVRQYQSATAINILALAHKRQGNIDQARQIFEQVLLDNPTNVLFLGNVFHRQSLLVSSFDITFDILCTV